MLARVRYTLSTKICHIPIEVPIELRHMKSVYSHQLILNTSTASPPVTPVEHLLEYSHANVHFNILRDTSKSSRTIVFSKNSFVQFVSFCDYCLNLTVSFNVSAKCICAKSPDYVTGRNERKLP